MITINLHKWGYMQEEKNVSDMTDEELGYHAYINLKHIEKLRNENQIIDIELSKRQQAKKAE